MAENMDSAQIMEKLETIVGKDNVYSNAIDLHVYAYDASAPSQNQEPLCVVSPKSKSEIIAILKIANDAGIPIVPRGSGTGLAGASIPLPNSIVLLTNRMNKILEIDEQNLTATVQPGVITADLAKAVEALGLFYPPDPSSQSISTLGGNIALDSGGLRGLKYGVTHDYVMGLEIILANGSVLRTGGKCKKDAAGYNLTSIFVGSEGTLGIVTEALLKLIPLPANKRTAQVFFYNVQAAAQVVAEIISAKIIPVTLELLDRVSLTCVDEYANLNLPKDAGAMLLIEVDGPEGSVDQEMRVIEEICNNNNTLLINIAKDEAHAHKLKEARRVTLAALARRKPTLIIEDVTVPRSNVPVMIQRIREIAKKYELEIAIFGHAGDGNLHPTAMTDSSDHNEIARAEKAFDEIFEVAINLGGTITGEHGIGIKKRHMLPTQIGSVGLGVMRDIKKALDPNNILNPEKIFTL